MSITVSSNNPSTDVLPQDAAWTIIQAFYKEFSVIHEQLTSFDIFMEQRIPKIIANLPPVVTRDKRNKCTRTITYGKCEFKRMKLPGINDINNQKDVTPQICRLRNLTYACTLYVTAHHTLKYDNGVVSTFEEKNVEFGDIPIMVKSKYCILYGCDEDQLIQYGECPNDTGGYFILGGKERVMIGQERLSYNQVHVFPDKSGLKAEIRCHNEDTEHQSTIHLKYSISKKLGPCIRNVIPHLHEQKGVLLFAVFMALGFEDKEEIIRMILYPFYEDIEMREQLEGSLIECESINTRDNALIYLSQFVKLKNNNAVENKHDSLKLIKKKWLLYILDRELYPHLHQNLSEKQIFMHYQDNVKVMSPWFDDYICSVEYRTRCREKAWFLAYNVNRLLRVALSRDNASDRDHMAHKRLNLSGQLMAQLFKKKIMMQHITMSKQFVKHIDENKGTHIAGAMKQNEITKGLSYALKTGNWSGAKTGTSGGSASTQNVTQVLIRLNYNSPISHMRRSSASDTNLSVVRNLHNTQYRFICPSETPEGQSCGLTKNLANLCHITTTSDIRIVLNWLNDPNNVPLIKISDLSVHKDQAIVYGWKIFVNGKLLGITPEISTNESCFDSNLRPIPPPEWVDKFRKARSQGIIDYQVSISTHMSDRKEIFIYTDEGRFSGPLLVVENGKLKLTKAHLEKVNIYLDKTSDPSLGWSWSDLLQNQIIEYIDAAETESKLLSAFYKSVNEKHTHCEIHPIANLGLIASLISFPNHSQAPRNTYQSAMGKQSLGIPMLNYHDRFDTTNYMLYYPQKPIVRTRMHDICNISKMPSTQCIIVAVAEFTGYNQEDSVILNQGFIDRGGGRCRIDKTYVTEAKKHKILDDCKYEKPKKEDTMGLKKGNYEKLDVDGIIEVGTRVVKGDIIAGITGPAPIFSSYSRSRSYNKANTKRVATNVNPEITKKDMSVAIKVGGVVDSVLVTDNGDQTTIAKIRVRTNRVPKIGDKFAAFTGQKGTVGLVLKQQDMPYCADSGIVPDIIMNPHAYPSRMTINQLIEMLYGRECLQSWEYGDSTPFSNKDNIVDDISEQLKAHGFDPNGEEYMINGQTGERIKAKIFMGPATYQRLKHMVDDKKHSRSRGPLNQLTRQPTDGRMRDGGLRFGEMEKDVIVAHGAAANLQAALMKNSDQTTVPICKNCGTFTEAQSERNVYYCRSCDNMDSTYLIEIPYAAKLLFQELNAMFIETKIVLDE